MAIVVNDRERIGEEKLGVLFDGGKARLIRRRQTIQELLALELI